MFEKYCILGNDPRAADYEDFPDCPFERCSECDRCAVDGGTCLACGWKVASGGDCDEGDNQ